MQQACVDDVLMSNYTELNDTASLISVTSRAVRNTIGFKCEPFDCNGTGTVTTVHASAAQVSLP